MEDSAEGVPSTSGSYEEAGRGCRNKRKQVHPSYCPVCSCTLRNNEVDQHLNCEIEKLHRINGKTKQNGKSSSLSPTNSNGSGSENGIDRHWETYQKVRSNRQCRQRLKSKKRKSDEVLCPVCNKETSEEINAHLERCLQRAAALNGEESDENIDVEGYEEYEWAGQSRVRATSMLQGGVSTLGTSISMVDDDEDLVVDGDDSQVFGSPQYSERDIIFPDIDKERDALRKVVIGTDVNKKCDETENNKMEVCNESPGDPVLEALKNRIRELESRETGKVEIYKCLICMERYRTPVISVCCWHVHCEVCWLQTLGAKKLCPQCNMITSPADLRRIYM